MLASSTMSELTLERVLVKSKFLDVWEGESRVFQGRVKRGKREHDTFAKDRGLLCLGCGCYNKI